MPEREVEIFSETDWGDAESELAVAAMMKRLLEGRRAGDLRPITDMQALAVSTHGRLFPELTQSILAEFKDPFSKARLLSNGLPKRKEYPRDSNGHIIIRSLYDLDDFL